MPHHHPCYCTDITKNSSPISKTLLLLAMSFSLADTSREKGISMWIGGHYSGTPCCILNLHYIHTLTSAETATH